MMICLWQSNYAWSNKLILLNEAYLCKSLYCALAISLCHFSCIKGMVLNHNFCLSPMTYHLTQIVPAYMRCWPIVSSFPVQFNSNFRLYPTIAMDFLWKSLWLMVMILSNYNYCFSWYRLTEILLTQKWHCHLKRGKNPQKKHRRNKSFSSLLLLWSQWWVA